MIEWYIIIFSAITYIFLLAKKPGLALFIYWFNLAFNPINWGIRDRLGIISSITISGLLTVCLLIYISFAIVSFIIHKRENIIFYSKLDRYSILFMSYFVFITLINLIIRGIDRTELYYIEKCLLMPYIFYITYRYMLINKKIFIKNESNALFLVGLFYAVSMIYEYFFLKKSFVFDPNIWMYQGGSPFGYRSGGLQGDPNVSSLFLGMIFISIMIEGLYKGSKFSFGVAILIFLGMFFGFSRAVFGGIAISIIFILQQLGIRERIKLISSIVAGLVVVIMIIPWENILSGLESKESFIYRPIIWKDSLAMFSIKNFLGTGFGSTSVSLEYLSSEWLHKGGAHNAYIQILLEGGIIGLIIYFFMIKNVIANVNRNKAFSFSKYDIEARYSLIVFWGATMLHVFISNPLIFTIFLRYVAVASIPMEEENLEN